MKAKIIGLMVVVVLVFAAAFTTAAPPNTKALPAATAQPSKVPAANPAEPHPEIREAIAALRRAKEHMAHAAHDFGGHRVEAIRATDAAIRQLEDCLRFDKD